MLSIEDEVQLNGLIRYVYDKNITHGRLLNCTIVDENTAAVISLQVIILLAAFLNSFRMGLAFEYKIAPRKNAKFLIIGYLCQFFLQPCLALLIVWLLRDLITPYQKMSVLCLGACPGGVASTAFAGLLGGNKEKATRISTNTVFFSWIFTPSILLAMSLVIDYPSDLFDKHGRTFVAALIACVSFAIVPLFLGAILRKYFFTQSEERMEKLQKFQKLLFLLEILTTLATVFLVLPQARKFTTRYIVTVGLLLPFITAAFGYVFAALVHTILLTPFISKLLPKNADVVTEYTTFGLTSGIQNNRLAMAVLVAWSFWKIDGFNCKTAFLHTNIGPALYGLSQMLTGGLAVLTNNTRKRNKLIEGEKGRFLGEETNL